MAKPSAKKPESLVERALKLRHVKLLEKMRDGRALTPKEIDELARFEGEDSPIPDGCVATQEDAAKILGVGVRTFKRWLVEGAPRRPEGGYDIGAINAWKSARGKVAGAEAPRPGDPTHRYREAKAALAEMELATRRDEYHRVDECRDAVIAMVSTARRRLLSLGRDVAPHVVGMEARAAATFIDKRVRNILEGLARARP